jgi:hypothetical protein
MDLEPRYSYRKHGNCPYFGARLLNVNHLSRGRFRVKESFLARNTEGMLGFIGEGCKWFLNFCAGEGSWCFNPISEEELIWSPYHGAYIRASQQEHFLFPVIIGEFYELVDGVKKAGPLFGETEIPKLPAFKFEKKSKYF